jgi:hypothetical protein
MFTKMNDDQLLETYRDCLQNGLVNQEDANYMTDNRGLMLLVAKEDRYIEMYVKGQRVLRLDYLQNGIDWDEALVGSEGFHHFSDKAYSTAIIQIYNEVLEGNGLRVIRDKKAKYLN